MTMTTRTLTEKQVLKAIKQALDDMDSDDLAHTYNIIVADRDAYEIIRHDDISDLFELTAQPNFG